AQVRALIEPLDPAPVDLLAGRAGRCERDDLVGRERTLIEHREHDPTDCPGGSDYPDSHRASLLNGSGSIAPSPRSNALCSARTACGTKSALITHEILIGDVEIISMLMSSAASVSNTFAATPGCERIPAPTIDTLPIRRSVSTLVSFSSPTIGSSARPGPRRASAPRVNETPA